MALDTIAPSAATRPQYDFSTAVTFLIAGLGLGSVLTLLFSSRRDPSSLLPSDMSPHSIR
jgi:hypothetical protein